MHIWWLADGAIRLGGVAVLQVVAVGCGGTIALVRGGQMVDVACAADVVAARSIGCRITLAEAPGERWPLVALAFSGIRAHLSGSVRPCPSGNRRLRELRVLTL